MANKYAAEELRPDMGLLTELYADQSDPKTIIDDIMNGAIDNKDSEAEKIQEFYAPTKKIKKKGVVRDYSFWKPNKGR